MGTAFLFGGLAIPVYSLCIAHVNDRVEPGQVVALASALVLVYGVGAAAGPLLASGLMHALGPRGLFVFSAVVLGGLTIFGVVRLGFRAGVAPEDKRRFVLVPRTTHAALQLHRDRRGPGPGTRARS